MLLKGRTTNATRREDEVHDTHTILLPAVALTPSEGVIDAPRRMLPAVALTPSEGVIDAPQRMLPAVTSTPCEGVIDCPTAPAKEQQIDTRFVMITSLYTLCSHVVQE